MIPMISQLMASGEFGPVVREKSDRAWWTPELWRQSQESRETKAATVHKTEY